MRALILDGREVIYKGEICQAVMPGRDGEFSVMDFHQPFLYRLRKGIVKIKENDEQLAGRLISIKDGLAKFNGNSLLILAEKE